MPWTGNGKPAATLNQDWCEKALGLRMDESVVVVDNNEEQCRQMCGVLQGEHFKTTALHSLAHLKTNVQKGGRRVVILDLDTFPVDNLFFRDLKRQNPTACIIGLSERSFHPELREAMTTHIYACLRKPLDLEELIYWVRCVREDVMS